GGGWIGGRGPVCPGALRVGEPVSAGAGGQLSWTDPNGGRHTGGLAELPISEYYGVAVYSRSGGTTLPCTYSPWQSDGFSWWAVSFPDPTWSQVGPTVAALKAQVEKGLVGGSVQIAPASGNALVGLPMPTWVVGSNVSALTPVVATKTVPGATVSGRQLQLTIWVGAQLNTVTWGWGNGTANDTVASGTEPMGAPGVGSSISYTYYDVSVYGEHPTPYPIITAQDRVPVSATLNLRVFSYAIFDTAAGRQQVALANYPLHLAVLPTWIRILQAEGIPFCPSTTSCA
ncbi:MAG: hypothetical protein ACYDEA_01880, partial [Candidatus Dormibacteria bacterium]